MNLKNAIKWFHLMNILFLTGLLGYVVYYSIILIHEFQQSNDHELLWRLSYPVGLFIYWLIMMQLTNRIEKLLYKENYTSMIQLLVVHSFMYGILFPLAFINYYILYLILVEYQPEALKIDFKPKDKTLYARLFLKIGTYIFIPYIIIKYINIMLDIYHDLVQGQTFNSYSNLFYFGLLLVGFMQLKVAEKELNDLKVTQAAIRAAVVGLIINPFTFHGLFIFISVGLILLDQGRLDEIKKIVTDFFEQSIQYIKKLIHK